MELRQLAPTDGQWAALDARPGRLLFQSRAWLSFVEEVADGEAVVAEVVDDDGRVRGYFFGVLVKAFGMRVLGSPLAGWTTAFLGFDVDEETCRTDLLAPLRRFAFGELGAAYVELRDRHMAPEAIPVGQVIGSLPVMEIDLERSEEEIFGAMTSAARRCIRKAEKVGVVIEECTGDDFADDYYAQLRDVFAKQQLVPTYDVERVRALIRHVGPTGSLLLLRARDAEGRSIATGIFPGHGDTAYFWGGASWREHQGHRPNEAIMWHAIRFWKARGATRLDLGGGGDYKLKYRPEITAAPTWAAARLPGLIQARHGVAAVAAARQRRRGRAAGALV